MASLTLQLDDAAPRPFGLVQTLTIGRLQDNSIVIDHPAVSSHHACVFRVGHDVVLEDLQSTNGTFVNGKPVSRCTLKDGDVVTIAAHKLVFSHTVDAETSALDQVAALHQGETMFVGGKERERVLSILRNAQERAGILAGALAGDAAVGTIRVVSGEADGPEYRLDSHTSLIGKARWAHIRLTGWFKPNVAVAITRNQNGYVATRLSGKMTVNTLPVNGRYDLKDGDVLKVGGLTLEFHFKESGPAKAA
jgi:pSer/pThr/pTyr-binding forkhead associated (FHA) protein